MKKTIYINDKEYPIDVDEDMPLLWFLRDVLQLTGTKYSCGTGLCGTCTVLVDGKAKKACVTRVGILAGRHVTTIEGLSENGDHPLQKAWLKNNVSQCGYCQPGQIMKAVSLLTENANPSEEEITDAMQRNICRCGTYQRIKKAVSDAATDMQEGS